MSEFKVGDTIMYDANDTWIMYGSEGVIKELSENGKTALVEFTNFAVDAGVIPPPHAGKDSEYWVYTSFIKKCTTNLYVDAVDSVGEQIIRKIEGDIHAVNRRLNDLDHRVKHNNTCLHQRIDGIAGLISDMVEIIEANKNPNDSAQV